MMDVTKYSLGHDRKLHWTDRFRWLNAYLFLGCGAIMIYRTYLAHGSWLAFATGVAFLAFGVYRLFLFRRATSGEAPPSQPRRRRTIGSRI